MLEYGPVLEVQDSDVKRLQIFFPQEVALGSNRVKVDLTIDFYGQLALRAVEIQNIPPDAMLPAELLACELRIVQALPEGCFGGREGVPQLPTPGFHRRQIMDSRPHWHFTTP
jgi:hypothetical protein